jgi:hypothetical protein
MTTAAIEIARGRVAAMKPTAIPAGGIRKHAIDSVGTGCGALAAAIVAASNRPRAGSGQRSTSTADSTTTPHVASPAQLLAIVCKPSSSLCHSGPPGGGASTRRP